MVAPEPENMKIDAVSGERQKLDRRKRRCPVPADRTHAFVDSSAGEGTDGESNAVAGFLDLRENLGGWTALHLAAIGGHLDVVYMLMEVGCDPRVKDKVGDQPIHCIRRKRTSEGLVTRLRNALLDLSDSEESSCEENMEPQPRRGSIRERRRYR
ncbi:Ankyrin repeat domain-containing protein 39 [Ectocarpus siliculosus]|uniref:Ankyrin repeat domain-containing protein 39 n=1 Tax=Ectocarpus siliculosus TaxID=2880 RepID=D7FIA3_ECTSI|nr:Ankyrin repeat domain-containing protein 39 [Ectocarpus siliculosus]|eukprot:CBJ28727.1 Ankyrin repeat domain-containing protein 39 [Ectocarpus siliculosus]